MIWLILEARQNSKNSFVRFLVQMRTRKFASEIYWPLVESSNDVDNFVTMGRLRLHNGKQLKIALQQTQLINNGEFQSCNFLQEIIFAQLGCCPKKGDTNFVTASADLTNCQGQWETATNCTSKDTINHNKSRKVWGIPLLQPFLQEIQKLPRWSSVFKVRTDLLLFCISI